MLDITIENLSKSFGKNLVLKDINLGIKAGEVFFLLGPSGCGKTTLLRHIAGFYYPDKGRVLFGGKDISRTPPHKRNTAMMFQSYALWPHLTVAQNVAFGLDERKVAQPEKQERVEEALALVKMEHKAKSRINELSGGQQQRVALARSMVVRPDCLLLDEPLSNLDAKLRLEMRVEIRRICKQFGLTAVYVTHDQKEALSMADRMAIMVAGELAQVGTPQEIFRQPASTLVADFIGETNLLTARVTGRDGEWWVVDCAQGVFRGRTSPATFSPSLGQSVRLSLRPEAISFTIAKPERNAIFGRVTEATYLGELAQYTLMSAEEQEIRLSELNPQLIRAPGTDAWATIAPEDVVILEK